MTPQGYIPTSASPGAHEGSGIHSRVIRCVAAYIGVILVLLALTVLLLLRAFEVRYAGRTSEASPRVTKLDLPSTPRLQVYPLRDLQEIRATEDLHLQRYKWLDRQQGLVQVPIDRAMKLWLQNYSVASPPRPPTPIAFPPTQAGGPTKDISSSSNASPQPTEAGTPSSMTELQMRQQKAQEAPRVP